jgi:ABC-type Fe3+ transport system substrate-binding protein
LAKKYNAELNAKTAADLLADSANKAANALDTMPNKYDQIFKNIYEQSIAMGNTVSGARAMAAMSSRLQAQADAFFAQTGQYAVQNQLPSSATTAAAAAQTPVTIAPVINTGAVLSSEQDLQRYIQDALGNVIKLGDGVVPRGSVILFQ